MTILLQYIGFLISMIKKVSRNEMRQNRHARVREKVSGTASVPRLSVFRSNQNIFAQIIDDEAHVTLVSASSIDKELFFICEEWSE